MGSVDSDQPKKVSYFLNLSGRGPLKDLCQPEEPMFCDIEGLSPLVVHYGASRTSFVGLVLASNGGSRQPCSGFWPSGPRQRCFFPFERDLTAGIVRPCVFGWCLLATALVELCLPSELYTFGA